MSKLRIYLLLMLTTLAWSSMAADDFDPANPPEPNDVYVPKHIITVTAEPAGMGYTSGSGKYAEGTSVKISTSSAVANWVFKEWRKDGELDATHNTPSFSYTLGSADVTFTAVYEYREPQTPQDPDPPVLPPFNPDDPGDPEAPEEPQTPEDPDPPTPPVVTPKYTLTLVSSPFEACAFNISSGREYTEGTSIVLKANGNQDFDFVGWYDQDDNTVSEDKDFTYTMPAANMTLTARWNFNPEAPDEPMDPNDEGDRPFIMGDINRDGMVTILDVMNAISFMLGDTPEGIDVRTADLNGDGAITIYDIMALINLTRMY